MMKRRVTTQATRLRAGVLALAGLCTAIAFANDGEHKEATEPHQTIDAHQTAAQKRQFSELVRIVHDATAKYQNVHDAESAGYKLQFGCVTGGEFGAMGLHYVKDELTGDDVLDPENPEIVIYEPTPHGPPRLIGADFLILKSVWEANPKHTKPPQLRGQLLHLFDEPNRFKLPAFYTLHVWAWKPNPAGSFVNWHTNVSCDSFFDDSDAGAGL